MPQVPLAAKAGVLLREEVGIKWLYVGQNLKGLLACLEVSF